MPKRVYIVEKPSVAKELVKALGGVAPGSTSRNGYSVLHNGDEVAPLFGHLLELAPPSHYLDGQNRFLDPTVLPLIPEKFEKVPTPERSRETGKIVMKGGVPVPNKQLGIIISRLKTADIIVHAGDVDREGQLIGDELIKFAGFDCFAETGVRVERLPIVSLDEYSLKKLLSKPRELNSSPKYRFNSYAGECRSEADWLMGMNLSRAQSIGANSLIHVGRIRTPVVEIVLRRDIERENFKPAKYFVPEITSNEGNLVLLWKKRLEGGSTNDLDPQGRIIQEASAIGIANRAKIEGVEVVEYKVTKRKKTPPLPFNLSGLQSEAGKRLKLTAKQVSSVAQKLYETHKLITYIGTDSNYLPEEQFEESGRILNMLRNIGIPGVSKCDTERKSPAWNSSKVSAHHAIIPTGVNPGSLQLEKNEAAIFDMIARRYASQFMPDYLYESTQLSAKNRFDLFGNIAIRVVQLGWHESEGSSPALAPEEEKNEE